MTVGSLMYDREFSFPSDRENRISFHFVFGKYNYNGVDSSRWTKRQPQWRIDKGVKLCYISHTLNGYLCTLISFPFTERWISIATMAAISTAREIISPIVSSTNDPIQTISSWIQMILDPIFRFFLLIHSNFFMYFLTIYIG